MMKRSIQKSTVYSFYLELSRLGCAAKFSQSRSAPSLLITITTRPFLFILGSHKTDFHYKLPVHRSNLLESSIELN